ncbi:peptidoglycan recognition protein family protein [Streptomyces smyrnaeus]|uniref:peptidoglycan recognition protein family protein n=1 Tax=Streptomyces smyrnaeus TaxID=1387713 RepID=UPI0033E96708
MATPLSAAAALAAFKAEGIKVQEYGNWRTHNRNHKGKWGPLNGVMIHHTVSSADASSVRLCYNGHSSLPGPLCHGVGRNDGVLALVGWGRANHAGSGDDDVLAAVIAERDLPADNEANTDGNARFYGLEIVNNGDNKDTYPVAQYETAVRFAAALCRKHGWNEKSVIGHKEWQPGKIDPRGPIVGHGSFTMAKFRADVKACLAQPAGKWSLSGSKPAPSKPKPRGREDFEWLAIHAYMPELRYGDEDWYVGWLQRNLNRLVDPNIKVTGTYDDATAKAVHQFYAEELDYKTTTGGKVFGADGWRRVLSMAKDSKGTLA